MGLFSIKKKKAPASTASAFAPDSQMPNFGMSGNPQNDTYGISGMPAPPKLTPIAQVSTPIAGTTTALSNKSDKKSLPDPRVSELSSNLSSQGSRLRTLEERYILLRRKTQVTEQNMLSHYKKASSDIKTSLSRIQELRNELREIKEKMLLIEKEVEQCARKSELALLQKYVNYWNPAEFVTKKEAERIIEDKLRELKQKQ